MLTGDKLETAINIAYGTLFTSYSPYAFVLNGGVTTLIVWKCIFLSSKGGTKCSSYRCAACSLVNNEMKQFILNSDVKEIRDVEERVGSSPPFP